MTGKSKSFVRDVLRLRADLKRSGALEALELQEELDRLRPTLEALLAALKALEGLSVLPYLGPFTFESYACWTSFDVPGVADRFLKDELDLEPNSDRRRALWETLDRGFMERWSNRPKWLTLEPEQARAYLRATVKNEATRLGRDEEIQERYWARNRKDLPKVQEMLGETGRPDSLDSHPEPEDASCSEVIDHRARELLEVLEELRDEGTLQDQTFASHILEDNYEWRDISSRYGKDKTQGFKRKIQRRLQKREISFEA
jgi:hypothetical protein